MVDDLIIHLRTWGLKKSVPFSCFFFFDKEQDMKA